MIKIQQHGMRHLLFMLITCAAVIFASAGSALKKSKPAAADNLSYAPQHGDILFQSLPHNPVIDAIEGSTGSAYSHCGIVARKAGGWWVLEAIGPVRETPLRNWVLQGREWKFAAHRLKPGWQSKIPAMLAAARTFKGRPYDLQYEFDDEKIYCSELIYKGFQQAAGESMGTIRRLGELNWRPYEAVIRQITGGELPLQREMITPKDLAAARQLEPVLPFGNYLIK